MRNLIKFGSAIAQFLLTFHSYFKIIDYGNNINATLWFTQAPGVTERSRTSKVQVLKTPEEDVLTSLEKFMETSTVGEFSVRLKMLRACHCQMVHTEASEKQGQ